MNFLVLSPFPGFLNTKRCSFIIIKKLLSMDFFTHRFFLYASVRWRKLQRNSVESMIPLYLEKHLFFFGKWVKKKLACTCSLGGYYAIFALPSMFYYVLPKYKSNLHERLEGPKRNRYIVQVPSGVPY
ncbi:MAG: hypothetical protein JSW00_06340 [Thermoplasmata archaeon]|nr:MAG: hypothetical protein JSW00_06340 [Thermoplasmata archaeon]